MVECSAVMPCACPAHAANKGSPAGNRVGCTQHTCVINTPSPRTYLRVDHALEPAGEVHRGRHAAVRGGLPAIGAPVPARPARRPLLLLVVRLVVVLLRRLGGRLLLLLLLVGPGVKDVHAPMLRRRVAPAMRLLLLVVHPPSGPVCMGCGGGWSGWVGVSNEPGPIVVIMCMHHRKTKKMTAAPRPRPRPLTNAA